MKKEVVLKKGFITVNKNNNLSELKESRQSPNVFSVSHVFQGYIEGREKSVKVNNNCRM